MSVRLKVLGCSGGIGGAHHTTSMLLDHDVLIDAGTGVTTLSLSELGRIDHVFLTHAHLDHLASLPLLVDSVGFMRASPITVYALQETLEAIRQHIFNWKIWPDFSVIPSPEKPYMRFQVIQHGETVSLAGRHITALPARHSVPAAGYQISSGAGSLVFSGDTTTNDAFWEAVNAIPDLRYLLIEVAFSDGEETIAVLSRHLCPKLLEAELEKFRGDAEVFITHLKPGEVQLIMDQVGRIPKGRTARMLLNNQEFVF
jgi:cAMP phosphodiesterase